MKEGWPPKEMLFLSVLFSEENDIEEWKEESDFITERDWVDDALFVIEWLSKGWFVLTSILFSSESLSLTVVSCCLEVDNCAIDPVVSLRVLLNGEVCASVDGA